MLVIIQRSILNQEVTQPVYQVIKNIETGTKITDSNLTEYLKLKEVQVSLIPEGYITSKDEIINKFSNKNYLVNDIITTDGLTDTEKLYKDNIENPVEVSFSVSGLAAAVAGEVREGDYINIYAIKDEEIIDDNGETERVLKASTLYTFKHVYVEKTYDGQGVRIESGAESEDATSTMFTIILDEKDMELFTETLSNCEIKIVRLMYEPESDYQAYITSMNKSAGTVEKTNK